MESKKTISMAGFVLAIIVLCSAVAADDSLAVKCSSALQKVTECLSFVTAKAAAPSKTCCDSVGGLKDSDPACLCFIIQQVHNGSNTAIKSMGVQETRLLQLPSACKLVNASITECPKLLHLPPGSPDAAIFTDNSTAASSTTPVATPGGGSTATPATNDGFVGYKPQQLAGSVMVVIAIFFHAFPTGLF